MRVISHRRIIDFAGIHKESAKPLQVWYRIISHSKYASFTEIKKTFPSADIVGKLTVFNIGGNKYRLIAVVHYNTQIVYIRHILTHREYDRGAWKI